MFRNSVAPQSRRRLALRFCSGESTANVVNTPLPSSTGTRTGIKEMSEPQAKTEGRLREARCLERGRGVEAGRWLKTPLRASELESADAHLLYARMSAAVRWR